MPIPDSDASLQGEGRLDVDAHLLISVLPWVREYQPQPMRLPIECRGGSSIYIPDGRLLGLSRPLCIEIKPLAKLRKSPDLGGRKKAIERALAARGEDFDIWTEREIRAEPLFSNAKLVWSCAQNLPPTEVAAACAALRHARVAVIADVLRALGDRSDSWRIVLGLIGLKVLCADLTRELAAEAAVRHGPRGWI